MLEDAKLEDNGNNSPFGSEQSESKSWGTSFEIGGKSYATSLFWQPLQNRADPYTEIAEASENVLEGSDLFCIKSGKSPQFGLCISAQGYTKAMPVATVGIINALSDVTSFLAVFKVDRGWWYVCVRNDVILSDGDMLFLNEEDAKQQFLSMLAVPDWGHKIAPAEWHVEDTKDIDVQVLLKSSAMPKLEKIRALRGTKLLIVIVAVAVAAMWLISTLISTFFAPVPKAPIVAPVAVKKVEPAPPPPEPKPWESTPIPEQIMASCFKAVKIVTGIKTPGWQIGGITCSPESLVTSWRRSFGRLYLIEEALDKSGVQFASRTLNPAGNEVVVSLAVDKPKTKNSPPKQNAVDLVNTMNDLFIALQMPASLNTQSWTSPQGNVYKSLKFSFTSKLDPDQWVKLLTKFSGLTINVIKYDVNNNSWYYEGAIYVL